MREYSSGESISSPSSSSFSRNTPEMEVSDSDTSENASNSLLHQALKRKRTESETENLFKRQFFLTTAPPNHYFNASQQTPTLIQGRPILRPTTSLLTSALTSPKIVARPIGGNAQQQQRPIFRLQLVNNNSADNQSPSRNLKLSATHVELCNLLAQSSSSLATSTSTSSPQTSTAQTSAPSAGESKK